MSKITPAISRSRLENGLAISRGIVPGMAHINKFGQAPDFDTTDGFVDIWDGANDGGINQMVYQFSTSADIDSLSSSNNGDTQDIEVHGLDTNYDEVTQTITITGQTRKALDTDLIRVFRMINRSSTDNAGDIYCYVNGSITLGVPDTAADVRAVIQAGNNQTLMAIYTVPDGKTGYLLSWYAAGSNAAFGASGISNVKLLARPTGEVFQLKHISSVNASGTSLNQFEPKVPKVFEAKTDIKISADTDINASAISGGFDMVLIDN